MKRHFIAFVTAFGLATLAACSADPGPLAGTWKMAGVVEMVIHFRNGETEAMGMIEPVSYDVKGNDVIVTYKDGPMKGTAMRYTMTGPNTARTALGTLQRFR